MIKKLLIAICFIWAGLVLGISFLEAPLKFTAPGIDLKLWLGIGRIVFTALNKIELILGVTAVLLLVLEKPKKSSLITLVGVIFILVLQSFWLLPILDARAQEILANKLVIPSGHHIYYIGLEVIKVILLLLTGVIFLKDLND